ncbi:DEAD/DEAH box helicase [Candidatus Neomarinimicrobiota bacterium]
MNIELFDFQKDSLARLQQAIIKAQLDSSAEDPEAISFSAPTGAGKTIVLTALFESIFHGEVGFPAQPDAAILWVSDMPELNEQTRLKIERMSDAIHTRQLIMVDSAFDAEKLEGGFIYFVNTQKLGTDKLLTRPGDKRQYSIWETFANTAKAMPKRFYVIIDEAHRGMRFGREAERAQTIMQRFLLGDDKSGLCKMPLVIGVSATPKRFNDLLDEAPHAVQKVWIPAEDVRNSGLLKDRILIHYPEMHTDVEMTLIGKAASHLKEIETHWREYCSEEKEEIVHPIIVVQVEDGTDGKLTRSDLPRTIKAIEVSLGRKLSNHEIVHTFTDRVDLEIAGHKIKHIESSRIEDDTRIRVVLFKMSLSTGWDCPRAEVMVSLRRAEDHTYIAQLLGRMVRSPLARRIEKNAALNDVHLILPKYNRETVSAVIADLENEESVPPSTIGTSDTHIILQRRKKLDKVFDAVQTIYTYRVNAYRKQSGIKRLMGLGRALTIDAIDKNAQITIKRLIVKKMQEEVKRLSDTGVLATGSAKIKRVNIKTVAVASESEIIEMELTSEEKTVEDDIEIRFNEAGRILSNGMHIEYWKNHENPDTEQAKIEVIVLAENFEALKSLEQYTTAQFDILYQKWKRDINAKPDGIQSKYNILRLSTELPQPINWNLPNVIDFNRKPESKSYDKHLYLEGDGSFRVDLGPWEDHVLMEEIQNKDVVGWLRNQERKRWALQIPYEDGNAIKPMFPDLLIIREDKHGYIIDILEPHDQSRRDNLNKARGLAKYASEYSNRLGRIELIRKMSGPDGKQRYMRLDIARDVVFNRILKATTNSQLDDIFDDLASVSP